MKRIILLVAGILLTFQMSALAEINRTINGNQTAIESYYLTKYQARENGEIHDCYFQIHFTKWDTARYIELIIFASPVSQEKTNRLLAFSMRNQPILYVVKDGVESTQNLMKQISGLSEKYYIKGTLNDKNLEKIFDADTVKIRFPTNENGYYDFEIPKSIVSEWEMVINTDLKKMRKDMI